jgi:outer membrane beta-barrel protein
MRKIFSHKAAAVSVLISSVSMTQMLFAAEGASAIPAAAATATPQKKRAGLADQMEQLSGGSNREKFYVVQSQKSGNAGVYDLAIGAGVNSTGDVNVKSTDTIFRAKYHANNHFFVSLASSQVKNEFNESAKRRISEDGIFPDVGFVTSRNDLSFGYNLIYGKARFTKDTVFFFDQYASLGVGFIEQTDTRRSSVTPALVGDLGISFWFARRVSLAVGGKTYRFRETRIATSSTANHVIGYANLGMLLGGAG